MASSSSFFQQQSMNTHQKSVLYHFSSKGLTAADFSGRDWFNSFYHDRAFTFLVNKKKCSFEEAFSILDKLDDEQAYAILRGLSRDEVVGLNKYQIDFFLKYGFSKDESLEQFQRQALLALRNDGIKSDDLRSHKWINSYHHAVALLYLIRVKEKTFVDACDYLKDLNSNEAKAISYGIDKSEVKGLENNAISLLIVGRQHDGLRSRKEVEGLTLYQIEMVRKLYPFGLTSQMIRDQIKQTGSDVENSLSCLVLERGIPIKSVLKMITGLNNYQIYGLSEGLSLDEMTDLNEYQIRALATCRTIKNGLTAEDLRGKSWFNSEKHVTARHSQLI